MFSRNNLVKFERDVSNGLGLFVLKIVFYFEVEAAATVTMPAASAAAVVLAASEETSRDPTFAAVGAALSAVAPADAGLVVRLPGLVFVWG